MATVCVDIVLYVWALRATARMDTLLHTLFLLRRLPFRSHQTAKKVTKQQHGKWIIFCVEVEPKAVYIIDSSSETSVFGNVTVIENLSSQPWVFFPCSCLPEINLNNFKLRMSLFWPQQQFDLRESCCQLIL